MDGENNGSNPYEQMGWFGGFSHYFWINTHMHYHMDVSKKGTPKWMVKIMELQLKFNTPPGGAPPHTRPLYPWLIPR